MRSFCGWISKSRTISLKKIAHNFSRGLLRCSFPTIFMREIWFKISARANFLLKTPFDKLCFQIVWHPFLFVKSAQHFWWGILSQIRCIFRIVVHKLFNLLVQKCKTTPRSEFRQVNCRNCCFNCHVAHFADFWVLPRNFETENWAPKKDEFREMPGGILKMCISSSLSWAWC